MTWWPWSRRSGGGRVRYAGGDGSSLARAVRIEGAADSHAGVLAEYAWLAERFGPREVRWTLERQVLVQGPDGRPYDRMHLRLANGKAKCVFFDASAFFGRH